MNQYKITAAIATYNRVHFLPGLFKSILDQTLDKSLFEILIVDNNSSDSTAEFTKRFIEENPDRSIRYVVEYNQGVSFSRNRLIMESRTDYIAFVDDDAIMDINYLQRACDFFDSDSNLVELGGPVYLKYLCPVPKWENKYMNSLLGYFAPSDSEYTMTKKNKKYIRGSNMCFRREEFLSEKRRFDTNLGRKGGGLAGGEEKEMAYKLLDMGLKIVYRPELIVYHIVPEERTKESFIKRQAIGVGSGERIRTKSSGEFTKRVFTELFKWGATLVLWVMYIVTLRPAKANMLVRFRWWVSKGLFGCRKI